MKALVTGATGFIGGNLVPVLLEEGFQVRALVRKGADTRNLEGLPVDIAYGDLLDQDSLERALLGCEVAFHLAACYSLWNPRPEAIYEVNVTGTKNLLQAARKAGIKRMVHTSSASTIGHPKKGGLGREDIEAQPEELVGHYKKSKYLGEKAALAAAREGLPVVVVNPTTPLGPRDIKPTPTGKVIVDYLNGRIPAYVNTGLNFIAVEDVARGHILALEKGRVGERYILGHSNLSFRDFLKLLEKATGIKAPRLKLPWRVALAAAYFSLARARLSGNPPSIPLEGVKMARRPMYFDPSRAVKELGLPQTPLEEAVARAVAWFRDNGYVKKPRPNS